MESALISETSVYFNETTWHYIPEGYHLHSVFLFGPFSFLFFSPFFLEVVYISVLHVLNYA
jgi:hypothetical protein